MTTSDNPSLTSVEFDASGFIANPADTLETLTRRYEQALLFRDHINTQYKNTGAFEIFDLRYTQGMEVTPDQLRVCQRPVIETYATQTPWVPAFFSNKGLSFIFGGMALGFRDDTAVVSKDAEFSLFQLRECFREKETFLIYSRTEIIAHESCHIARMALNATKYEELLAYRISSSKFRRWWGPIIRGRADVFLFFCTILLCLFSQIAELFQQVHPTASIIAKAPLFIQVIYLTLRNWMLHRSFAKALEACEPMFGTRSEAVLFRLTDDEIDKVAQHGWHAVESNLSDLRRSIISQFKK